MVAAVVVDEESGRVGMIVLHFADVLLRCALEVKIGGMHLRCFP